jgi:hypothetical protein
MIRRALCAVLLLAAAGASAQQPPPPVTDASPASALWSLRFPAATELVDALGIDEQADRIIDDIWQPAIVALAAANPDRPEAARRFAEAARAEEVAGYPPIVAWALDNHAVELLDPEAYRQLKALEERSSAQQTGTPGLAEARQRLFAEDYRRIMSAPLEGANGEFAELARLARTSDGLALKELQRRGYHQCEFWKSRRRLSPEDEARCRTLAASPALARLAKSPPGERLIRVSNFAHSNLIVIISLAHDAGSSIDLLLPAAGLRAAGLAVPGAGDLQPGRRAAQ